MHISKFQVCVDNIPAMSVSKTNFLACTLGPHLDVLRWEASVYILLDPQTVLYGKQYCCRFVVSLNNLLLSLVNRMIRPLLMCFALCVVYATSKPTEKKERTHHEAPLSSREHVDAEGFEYDHEAFLGKEQAKTFDDLTPEESKRRLGWGKKMHSLKMHNSVWTKGNHVLRKYCTWNCMGGN